MPYFCEMFRQVTAAMILMAFIAQTFNGAVVLVDYYTNTTAFAKNCINKAKPAMHCNGKCQMMKKLQEEEKKEQQQNERKIDSKSEVLSSKSFYTNVTNVFSTLIKRSYSTVKNGSEIQMPRSFFHPPTV